ncbi:SusE domain-containing protein [Flavobacterium sp. NRK1]|uniref:SusE domain-containing protein n=1 Tax=Flavobacterium sp. NRK1 TaxID=2954929 RepID=UPI002091F4F7|nr:SusE domain-containing protein [Flavobacterium sp. NRK1]MCO6149708.1 SusE domain-containing protein [Flavobacterium sp. NRK1]
MKNIYSKLLLIVFTISLIGCQDDDTLSHTKVSAVNALYAPADNTFFDLGAQSSALFEWEGAKAEDNGVVLYDVVFDREDGDFSNPVYIMPSDGNGFQRTLNISFTDLNKIAGMAGIPSDSNGKLKWTVYSSKGINVVKSAVSGIFEVKTPAGFPMPDQLFITGSGSEGGDAIADAVPFKKTGATKYEIYTKLKAGDYKFITRKSDNHETYYIDGGDLKADGATTYSGEDKVYRIRIDFSDGSTTMEEIQKIEIWFPPFGEYLFEYTYSAKGIWKADNQHIEFKQESWGRDERYKFKFTVIKQDGSSVEEWWGSINADNSRPDENTAASFWYMVPVTDDYWANSFKFKTEDDNADVNAVIDFSATAPAYTHSFTVI